MSKTNTRRDNISSTEDRDRADSQNVDECFPMSNGIRQQPDGNLIVKTDGFKRRPSLKRRFEGRLTQGNVARF